MNTHVCAHPYEFTKARTTAFSNSFSHWRSWLRFQAMNQKSGHKKNCSELHDNSPSRNKMERNLKSDAAVVIIFFLYFGNHRLLRVCSRQHSIYRRWKRLAWSHVLWLLKRWTAELSSVSSEFMTISRRYCSKVYFPQALLIRPRIPFHSFRVLQHFQDPVCSS